MEKKQSFINIPNNIKNHKDKILDNYRTEKDIFFDIYNKLKNGEYSIQDLTVIQAKMIKNILKSEIAIKSKKYNKNIEELNKLKSDNETAKKNVKMMLYKELENETIDFNDLDDIDKKSLLKIIKL